MSTARVILLTGEVLVFVLWSFLMFRTLFQLRRRAADRTGHPVPGPVETLREWRGWLHAPDDARARRWLGLSTLALIVFIALSALQTP